MQPTHARWEFVPPESPTSSRKRKLDTLEESRVNGTALTTSELPANTEEMKIDLDPMAPQPDPTTALATSPLSTTLPPAPLELPPPSSLLTRNYLIVDTLLETTPYASLPIPGPEEPETTPLYDGSGRLPDLNEEDLADLPPECREAFLAAKQEEGKWRDRWGTQERDGWRGQMRIGIGVLGI